MKPNLMLALLIMFFVPFFVVLVSIILGQQYALYRSKKKQIQPGPVGAAVGASFGLLAFMLAFTFQIAANRYTTRKELLLTEVTNIRTTYLRAGLIPQPFQSSSRKLLVEYVDLRVDLSKDQSKLENAMFHSQQILDTLWSSSEKLTEIDRSSEAYSLYISSVNDLVDNYNHRVTMTLEYRIPNVVLVVLGIITFLSMFVLGYQFGTSGKGNYRLSALLAAIFAIVMLLILALDRPETGLAKINQKPMLTLQKQLREKQTTEKDQQR